MATATQARSKGALRPTSHSYDALTGILHIADADSLETGYFLDVTADGVLLTKLADRATCYAVAPDAGAVCSCPGYRYRGTCRHARAVALLIEEGAI